ncbi:uncharacterized protein LOC113291421 [Papaver somniferum]|uniref:uncharacterized protein LOC113291421 n=1 Tax=Papaver somniferum TaxID=3469 RepID=UPI000E6FB63C|nr:uncharacterized protein LOC113291421 [Papaver somniferum]
MKNSKILGRIERWNAQVGKFGVKYEILSSPKSQVIADFLAEFPLEEGESVEEMIGIDEDQGNPKDLITERNSKRWEIFVDGSVNNEGNDIGILFISPQGARMVHTFRLEFASTNNETEYEGVMHALKLAVEMDLDDIRVTSDSQLVIRQIQDVMIVENVEEKEVDKEADWRAQLHLYLEKGEVPRNKLEMHKLKSREKITN